MFCELHVFLVLVLDHPASALRMRTTLKYLASDFYPRFCIQSAPLMPSIQAFSDPTCCVLCL